MHDKVLRLCGGLSAVLVGLGPVEHLDSIRIDWRDGCAAVYPGTGADQTVSMERGKGREVRT